MGLIICWNKDKQFQGTNPIEVYEKANGCISRDNGPSIVQYYDNSNQIAHEHWVTINREDPGFFYHRADGPARTAWNIKGEKLCEEWYVNNQRHRLDGPAVFEKKQDLPTLKPTSKKIDYNICKSNYSIWWQSTKGQVDEDYEAFLRRTPYSQRISQRIRTKWFINGVDITSPIRNWFQKQGIDENNLTDEDKFKITMRWA